MTYLGKVEYKEWRPLHFVERIVVVLLKDQSITFYKHATRNILVPVNDVICVFCWQIIQALETYPGVKLNVSQYSWYCLQASLIVFAIFHFVKPLAKTLIRRLVEQRSQKAH